MNKIQDFIKQITKKEYLPLWIFAIVQAVYHLLMKEPESSDAMWFFRNQLYAYSLKEYLSIRYATWASRLLIEGILVYVSRCIALWKFLDWAVWVFLAWAVTGLFPKKKRAMAAWMAVGFWLIYPMKDLKTAGWIATSVNYTWPLAFGIFSLHGTAKAFYGEKTPLFLWALYGIAALFGANMEQMSAVLLAVNFCAAVWFILKKEQICLYGSTIICFAVSAAEFVFILTCPGNLARKNQEIINWMPNFIAYHALDKASMGFVDTMHHLIASGNLLYLCYTLCLAVLAHHSAKDLKFRAAALFPAVFNIWLVFFGNMAKRYQPSFYKIMGKKEFIRGDNYQFAVNYLPTVLYLTVIGCMLLSLTAVCTTLFELFAQILLLALGLATRVIMGFTPTIYVSQERTFLYLYMILGISGIFLMTQHFSLIRDKKSYEMLKLAGTLLAVAGLFFNLAEIGAL